MLRITLYKNCILNETYQNVISNGKDITNVSILEQYLSTLSSYSINDLDEVYYKNTGVLNLDLELLNETNIYEYNYMKVRYYDEDENLKLIRYCFIQDIQVNNDIVQLYYTEDIFSSYADKIIKITESYLERSRVLKYYNKNIELHTLPINYDGNNIPTTGLTRNSLYNNGYVIANIQIYSSGVYGNSTKRIYKTCLLGYVANSTISQDIIKHLTIDEILKMCNFGNAMQSGGRVHYLNEEWYYRIENYKLIPFNILDYFETTEIGYISEHGTSSLFSSIHLYEITNDNKNKMINIHNVTVDNDFTRLSIGTFNNQIPTINNGTSISIYVKLFLEDAGINIYLYILNQIIDITEDFTYTVPFDEIDGETLSLYNTQRQLKNISTVVSTFANIWTGGMSISANLEKIEGLNSSISKLAFTKTGKPTSNAKNIKAINRMSQNIIGLEEENKLSKLQGYGKMGDGILSLINNNLPYYTSNKGNFAKSDAIFNLRYGICGIYINEDNADFVLKSINNTGYVVYEYCDDLEMIDFNNPLRINDVDSDYREQITFDIIKFSSINIIGSFPRSVALELNSIFENGFKIWYDASLIPDTMGVQ